MSLRPIQLCDPYLWEDPRYVFGSLQKTPTCASELINQIVFVYIVAYLLGLSAAVYLHFTQSYVFTGILATLFLIPTFLKLRNIHLAVHEPVSKPAPAPPKRMPDILFVEGFENNKSENPFNNVMVDEYPKGLNKPAVRKDVELKSQAELDDLFRVQWYSDPSDVFGKTQGQRMFVTQPNTSIPNDQKSYQEWLYKIPGKTCKEGNPAACYGGTSGAPMPWLN